MPEIRSAFGDAVTMVTTNLQNLPFGATTGWQSAVVDNTTDLYLDALVQVTLDFVSIAPFGSGRAVAVFAYGGLETTYTKPATGTEGTIALPDPTTSRLNLKLVGIIAYNTTGEVLQSQPLAVAPAFGGILPPKWGIVIANYSGAALAASGNSVKWRGVYGTQA